MFRSENNNVSTRDVAIQTDYRYFYLLLLTLFAVLKNFLITFRDAEVQTDPYSPPYEIPEGAPEPMIVSLAPFTFGHGLPAGAYEVAQIEKAQARRAQEEALPQGDDPASFKARVEHFASAEQNDWLEREEEVREQQEQRIKLLREALEQRAQNREAATQERVAKARTMKNQEKDEAVHSIEKERVKALRHFTIEAREPEGRKKSKKDKIADYYHYESKAYAPLPRDGQVGDRPVARVTVRNDYTETLNGVLFIGK